MTETGPLRAACALDTAMLGRRQLLPSLSALQDQAVGKTGGPGEGKGSAEPQAPRPPVAPEDKKSRLRLRAVLSLTLPSIKWLVGLPRPCLQCPPETAVPQGYGGTSRGRTGNTRPRPPNRTDTRAASLRCMQSNESTF